MTAQVQHLKCECGYTGLCPWDRFCPTCGTSLVNGFSVTEEISVGRDKDAISVVLENKSRVAVTVHAPPIFQHRSTNPPDWLDYAPFEQGRWTHTLQPAETRVVQYKIRRSILEDMLQDGTAKGESGEKPDPVARAVQFELLVCSDADYTRQDHVIRLSLSGQADLRPARLEFPLIPLHAPQNIDLPFQAYNASGQSMRVHSVTVSAVSTTPPLNGDDALGRMVTDLLFPADAFAALRDREIGPGQTVDLKVTSRPVAEALESFTERQDKPLFDDPYWGTDRFKAWYWRWPTLLRLRFVVEAQLRSGSGDDNSVRSLVVLTLVRPPNLMDATPEDALWKVVSGPGGQEQAGTTQISLTGEGTLTAVADVSNNSAIPVFVEEMVSTVPWMKVTDAPIGKLIAPGQEILVKVEIDPSKRAEEDLQEQHLEGYIRVVSRPPLLEDRLEAVVVKTSSTLVVPGCLGVDFGTSNCSVCFLPGAEWPSGAPVQMAPVELSLERLVGEPAKPGMPSIMWRRYTSSEQAARGEFAFGSEAASLWQSRPSNVRRAIKRILASPEREHTFEENNDARPVVRHSTRILAELMIGHVIREAQRLASTSDVLRDQLMRLAREAETAKMKGFPTPEEVGKAEAFRFDRAVFTHPVEAGRELRELLYDAAMAAGLAQRTRADGQREPHTFDTFESDCMVDEATAAMTMFVDSFKDKLSPGAGGRRPGEGRPVGGRPAGGRPSGGRPTGQPGPADPGLLIVCLDIGGGTTDISVMRYLPRVRRVDDQGRVSYRSQLHLLNRAGINDFAGEDLDLRIVERVLAPALNEKLSKPHPGAALMVKHFRSVLQGASASQIANTVEQGMVVNTHDEAIALAAAVVKGAHLLRGAAETLKKAAGSGGQLKTTLDQMPPFLVNGVAYDGSEFKSTVLTVDLEQVSQVIRDVVADRLWVVDRALTATLRDWCDVDVLLFTGQTTRSVDVRSSVLEHVRQQRETPLKFVVVPPSDRDVGASGDHGRGAGRGARTLMERLRGPGTTSSAVAETVLEFDPKVCVPGGAAIYGSKCMETDRLEVVRARRSEVGLTSLGETSMQGTPLPVFMAVEVDWQVDPPEAIYDAGTQQLVVPLVGLPGDVNYVRLVLVEPLRAFLVGSRTGEDVDGLEGDRETSGEPPSSLGDAVQALSPKRAADLNIDPKQPLWWLEAPLSRQSAGDAS